MYTIKAASHSLGNFYQVLLNDVIVAQFDSLNEAQEYVANKLKSDLSLDFSKATIKAAQKVNVELCIAFDDELHLIKDSENNDCATCAYKLVDGALFLVNNWSSLELPAMILNEKELRQVIKAVGV